jgi:DNA primase
VDRRRRGGSVDWRNALGVDDAAGAGTSERPARRLHGVAGRIRDEDIATIREKARIDEIVGEYVALRNAGGGSLKGLCPFHDEKTPSFHVTPARGMYFCFGCNQGGDVIRFVEKVEQLSFTEALERLAVKVGLQLRYEEARAGTGPQPHREQRTRLVEAHRDAAAFYAEQLAESAEAMPGRRFLDERGFDREAAVRFGVGYAPRAGEALRKHLRQRGFADDELVAGGLVSPGRTAPYDRFRGRLVWPIRDLLGDVVGFGARRLFDDDRIDAKYLNTAETPIYKKSHVLYGVDLAKKEIARRSQAVVVEGYTDVMACHLAGVETAVATCGTSFGEDHARVLRRLLRDQDEFRGEVVFTFDGDAAGQKAAMRAFEGDQRFVGQTFVAVEPDGLDPCELRQRSGDAAVRELVARRQPLFHFAIRTTLAEFDLDTAEGRTRALDRTIPLVARIRDHALRDEYARKLAGWVGAPDELAVVHRARALSGSRAGRPRVNGPAEQVLPGQQALGVPVHGDVDPQTLELERAVLRVAIQRPALAGPQFDELEPEAFLSPAYRALAETVRKAGGCSTQGGGPAWVDALTAAAVDEASRMLVAELAVEAIPADDTGLPRYAESVVLRLHEIWISRRLVTVKARLQRTDPSEQTVAYNRLFAELMTLEKHRRDLRERGLGTS